MEKEGKGEVNNFEVYEKRERGREREMKVHNKKRDGVWLKEWGRKTGGGGGERRGVA